MDLLGSHHMIHLFIDIIEYHLLSEMIGEAIQFASQNHYNALTATGISSTTASDCKVKKSNKFCFNPFFSSIFSFFLCREVKLHFFRRMLVSENMILHLGKPRFSRKNFHFDAAGTKAQLKIMVRKSYRKSQVGV